MEDMVDVKVQGEGVGCGDGVCYKVVIEVQGLDKGYLKFGDDL